jgi:hypothetical protein
MNKIRKEIEDAEISMNIYRMLLDSDPWDLCLFRYFLSVGLDGMNGGCEKRW